MKLDHSHLKDIEYRIEHLDSHFKILVNPSSKVKKELVLKEMERAASEIVEAIQAMQTAPEEDEK